MNELTKHDLSFCVRRLPKALVDIMKDPKYWGKVFVAGGFIRAVVTGERVNDIDIFLTSKEKTVEFLNDLTVGGYLQEGKSFVLSKGVYITDNPSIRVKSFRTQGGKGEELKEVLETKCRGVYITDNAITLRGYSTPLQIITRWTFNYPWECIKSFDFTIVQAGIYYTGEWKSVTSERFYADVAAKRLIYTIPEREEEPGGSMLRILKYYQRGYRIPLNSLSQVMVRVLRGIRHEEWIRRDEPHLSMVVCGLLREVDPSVDPLHEAHLPIMDEDTDVEPKLEF